MSHFIALHYIALDFIMHCIVLDYVHFREERVGNGRRGIRL